MSQIGYYQQGDTVFVGVRCADSNGVATMPDAAPTATIKLGLTTIQTLTLPVVDRHGTTAWFAYCVFLDSRYGTAGTYTVTYSYEIGAAPFTETDTFEVLAGGDAAGHALSMFYARGMAAADFVMVQTESGQLLRKRNPRIV